MKLNVEQIFGSESYTFGLLTLSFVRTPTLNFGVGVIVQGIGFSILPSLFRDQCVG